MRRRERRARSRPSRRLRRGEVWRRGRRCSLVCSPGILCRCCSSRKTRLRSQGKGQVSGVQKNRELAVGLASSPLPSSAPPNSRTGGPGSRRSFSPRVGRSGRPADRRPKSLTPTPHESRPYRGLSLLLPASTRLSPLSSALSLRYPRSSPKRDIIVRHRGRVSSPPCSADPPPLWLCSDEQRSRTQREGYGC